MVEKWVDGLAGWMVELSAGWMAVSRVDQLDWLAGCLADWMVLIYDNLTTVEIIVSCATSPVAVTNTIK